MAVGGEVGTAPHAIDPYGPTGRSAWLEIDWTSHQRWVEVEGRPVNVIALGEGPPVVFVHGLSGVWQNWLETLPDIARDHRVIALDLPGFGRSPMPARKITISGYGRLLCELMDALDAGPATFVGNSMGGFVAADLAIHHPARVDRLVLVAAAGISVEQLRNDRGMALLRRLEALVELYGSFVATRSEAIVRRRRLRQAMLRMVMAHPERLPGPLVREQLEGTGAPGFLDAIEALTTYPIRERLREVTAPTLVVWGGGGPPRPPRRRAPLHGAHRRQPARHLPGHGTRPDARAPRALPRRPPRLPQRALRDAPEPVSPDRARSGPCGCVETGVRAIPGMALSPRFWFSASHEQFPPSELLEQAVAAERAGFDGVGCSDHFAPWWPGGESGQAWVWLGAAAQRTERVPVGTGVTALVHRYHPAVVAQAFMTLEEMFPGRVFLGTGSGEALNEVPCGADWPPAGEQISRLDAALDVITRLWDGETVTADGGYFRCNDAVLHTRASSRPKLYVSAFGPQAARVAATHGDGLWTLGDPESAPEVIDAYRAACEDQGREPGEIILHTGIAWARDEDTLMEGARGWRGAQPPAVYTDAITTPEQIQDFSAPRIDDEALKEGFIITTDADEHIERVRGLVEMGATVVCLQNVSGADPTGTIETYRETVLPALRDEPALSR